MQRSKFEAVARIAARQHGLITRAQAMSAGFDSSAIRRERASGRWGTVGRGVYIIAGAPRTWHTSVLERCLVAGGVASHRTCAVLLKAGRFRPGPPEVSVASASKAHGAGSRIHESHDFHLIRPIIVEGIPTTPPARLGVDLGAVVSFERYEETMDQLVARGAVSWDELFDNLVTHAKRGRNGVGSLRAYLKDRYGSTIEGTPLERWFRRELKRRSFPDATTELNVYEADGTFLARVDIAFEDARVIVELDSLEWHFNRTSFTKDPTVRRRLRLLGWFVLEVTWDMLVNDAPRTFADLRQLLAERTPPATSLPPVGPTAGAAPVVLDTPPIRDRPPVPTESILDVFERAFGTDLPDLGGRDPVA